MNPIFKNKDEIQARIEALTNLLEIRRKRIDKIFKEVCPIAEDDFETHNKIEIARKFIDILGGKILFLKYNYEVFDKEFPNYIKKIIESKILIQSKRMIGIFTSPKIENKRVRFAYDFKRGKMSHTTCDKLAIELCEQINLGTFNGKY